MNSFKCMLINGPKNPTPRCRIMTLGPMWHFEQLIKCSFEILYTPALNMDDNLLCDWFIFDYGTYVTIF